MQGGTEGCRPPARGSGSWEPPKNSRGSGGGSPLRKNNFMDPEPGFWDQDLVFFVPEPGFWDQDLVFFVQHI